MKTRLFLISALIAACSTAQSQTPKLPDSGQLLRQNTQQERTAIPVAPKPGALPAPLPQPLTQDSGVRFVVSGFVFDGNTKVPSKVLEDLCSAYASHELSLADLNGIASMVTNYYRGKGFFLAQAYVPPQNTKSGGAVKIVVIEGMLESIAVTTKPEATRVPRRLLDGYVAQVPTGVPAEDEALNTLTMFLNDLPALNSRVVLEPGSTSGYAKARVEITEGAPCQFWIDGDNQGSYATGYYRVGARMVLNSPLHLGDRLDLHLQSSTTGNTQIANANYTLPAGTSGAKFGINYAYVRYKLGENYEALDAKGEAHNLYLNLDYPLVRTRMMTVDLTAATEGKLLDDRMEAFGTSNKRDAINVQLGASAVMMDTFMGGGNSSVSVTGTTGTVDIKDAGARVNDTPPVGYGINGSYTKFNFALSRNQLVYKGLVFYALICGQWADGNLDSSDQLSLGGPYAVRAYPLQEAMCDRGFVSTAELSYPIEKFVHVSGSLRASIFIDHAEGDIRVSPSTALGSTDNKRDLTGFGIGLTWYSSDSFSIRTSIAWRTTSKPETDNNVGDKPTIYIQVNKKI